MSELTKFTVVGHAFVPVEVRMEVSAKSSEQAKLDAARLWDEMTGNRRRDFIVPRSEDEGAVFDFQPNEATPDEQPD